MSLSSKIGRTFAGISLFKALLAGTVVATAYPAPGYAQSKPAGPAADNAQTAPLPKSPVEEAEENGNALRVTVKDITRMALQNNLDIAISDTNEEIQQTRVQQAYGPYDPALSITLGAQSTRRPNTNLTNRSTQGAYNKTDLATWNFQLTKNLPTGGGIIGTYNSSRSDTNQQFALFSPQYTASTSLQITQPLFRNFRIDQFRGAIRLAKLDVRISDSQFKQTVTNTVAGIQSTYWDLVGAIQDYEIRRDSVRLAQILLRNNTREVEIGVLAPISITEARAGVASRQVDLITARQTIINAENNLRALVSSDRNSEIWQKVIVPAETPEFRDYPVDLDQAIDTALAHRPELEQYSLQLQQNDISYNINRNLKKWQVDLVASVGSIGVAGPQTVNPVTGEPLIAPELIGGVGTANTTLFTQGYFNWFAGFNLTIPLRNRGGEAQIAESRIQREQLLINRKNTEQKIVVQVRTAVADLDTQKQRVQTAAVARQLAEEQLTGETKRFQAGLSQNFLVLQRQNELATAKGVELQALIAYRKSIISLQQALSTLLESSDFEFARSVPQSAKLN